jgi:restriction system protein
LAAFWCTGGEFLGILEEYAGKKAGLALSRDKLLEHIPTYRARLPAEDHHSIRVRHEEMEGAVRELLIELGAAQSEETPSMALLIKYWNDPEAKTIADYIGDLFFKQTFKTMQSAGADRTIQLNDVMSATAQRFGARGLTMFKEFHDLLIDYQQGSLGSFRRTAWKDVKELNELFASGRLAATHGTFIDQRFIDYLAKQFAAIDAIHWRQFEALTAEFFSREGYKVALGPGRDDGGVDIRVWRDAAAAQQPPTILVQCKRQKDKVGKVVVKALWADVIAENAESGLIVTSSALQPGAENVCIGRGYPVSAIDRPALARWLEQLRTPGNGLFMSG